MTNVINYRFRNPQGPGARDSEALREELEAAKDALQRQTRYLEEYRSSVFHILRDIETREHELETAYKNLKLTQAQLIQSSKLQALGELAAGLAHELNQPLTVIKGLAHNVLRRRDARDPDFEKIQLIAEASGKMETIIKHLRLFTRRDSEEPGHEPVDVNRVIKDAFIMLRDILVQNSITVRVRLGEIPPVTGSFTRLEQVIINLATNAKDAMPGGGVLEVSTDEINDGGDRLVRVSVSDTGSGIRPEDAERIFEPFFTTKEPGKGTGLGLSISSAIIKEHRGLLTVRNNPERGVTFQITLPSNN